MNISKFAVSVLALSTSLLTVIFVIYHHIINTESNQSNSSNIQTIYSLKPFEEAIKFTDQDSLVIFDVSNVIFINKDPGERKFKKERLNAKTINSLQKEGSYYFSLLDRKLRDQLWSIRKAAYREMLIDPNIVNLIHNLQVRSVKTIALTRCLVGREGQTPPLQQLRIKKLFAHGIDFSKSFSFNHPLIFKQFSYEKRFPIFEKGILFTTFATTKGKLLKAFLEKINWSPNKIIMIDDDKENLNSVATELKNFNIPFIGFEYKEATKFTAFFDKDIAEFQMKYLVENKKWLTAKEAAKYVNKEHLVDNMEQNYKA